MDKSYYTEGYWYENNGIIKRRHTYFFTSSHERGLHELLAIWPEVRKAIPDATLHVGYGTITVAGFLKDRRDYKALDEIRATEQQMYEMEGIVYHQRLNQWDLARLQMECEAWLYPYQPHYGDLGGFLETYCITAVEAMAAKAIPITRMNGALPEVVPHYILWDDKMTSEKLIKILKQISDDPDADWNPNGASDGGHETLKSKRANIRKNIEEIREKNHKWAMSQSWNSLAREWLIRLLPKIDDKQS